MDSDENRAQRKRAVRVLWLLLLLGGVGLAYVRTMPLVTESEWSGAVARLHALEEEVTPRSRASSDAATERWNRLHAERLPARCYASARPDVFAFPNLVRSAGAWRLGEPRPRFPPDARELSLGLPGPSTPGPLSTECRELLDAIGQMRAAGTPHLPDDTEEPYSIGEGPPLSFAYRVDQLRIALLAISDHHWNRANPGEALRTLEGAMELSFSMRSGRLAYLLDAYAGRVVVFPRDARDELARHLDAVRELPFRLNARDTLLRDLVGNDDVQALKSIEPSWWSGTRTWRQDRALLRRIAYLEFEPCAANDSWEACLPVPMPMPIAQEHVEGPLPWVELFGRRVLRRMVYASFRDPIRVRAHRAARWARRHEVLQRLVIELMALRAAEGDDGCAQASSGFRVRFAGAHHELNMSGDLIGPPLSLPYRCAGDGPFPTSDYDPIGFCRVSERE